MPAYAPANAEPCTRERRSRKIALAPTSTPIVRAATGRMAPPAAIGTAASARRSTCRTSIGAEPGRSPGHHGGQGAGAPEPGFFHPVQAACRRWTASPCRRWPRASSTTAPCRSSRAWLAAMNLQAKPAVPVATANLGLSLKSNTELAVPLAGTDADGDALDFRISRMPVHGTLEGVGNSLKYRPHPDFVGVDGFTFVVSDGVNVSQAGSVQLDGGGAVKPRPDRSSRERREAMKHFLNSVSESLAGSVHGRVARIAWPAGIAAVLAASALRLLGATPPNTPITTGGSGGQVSAGGQRWYRDRRRHVEHADRRHAGQPRAARRGCRARAAARAAAAVARRWQQRRRHGWRTAVAAARRQRWQRRQRRCVRRRMGLRSSTARTWTAGPQANGQRSVLCGRQARR